MTEDETRTTMKKIEVKAKGRRKGKNKNKDVERKTREKSKNQEKNNRKQELITHTVPLHISLFQNSISFHRGPLALLGASLYVETYVNIRIHA